MTRPATLTEAVASEIRAEMGRQRISIAALERRLGKPEMYLTRRLGRVKDPVVLNLDDVEQIAEALNLTLGEVIRPSVAA